jgi:hypothetical protein
MMQTIQLKYDIISWVTGLNDKNLVSELHQWMMSKEKEDVSVPQAGCIPPKRKGKLTEGFGIWAADTMENNPDYRKKIWQTGRNTW